jgi:hypothetical protein
MINFIAKMENRVICKYGFEAPITIAVFRFTALVGKIIG